jgi:zinc protease
VGFGCSPERVAELTRVVFAQIDSVRQFGLDGAYVAKLQEMQRRQRQVDLEKNGFWLEALKTAYADSTDPRVILRYEELVGKLNPQSLQEVAQRCLREENHVRVVLYPKEDQAK